MNILYFIYSHGQASGGHYHSLDQISKEVGKGNNVRVVTLGPKTCPVLTRNNFFLKHIFIYNKIKSLFALNRELRQIIKIFKPDILHCFDTDSLNRLLVLPSTFDYPIVLNKCGGPKPMHNNYYHANGLVVFNTEDFHWFKKNKYYKKELIFLIPNRVEKLRLLPENEREEQKDKNKITFLRVTRLGGVYEKTLKDSFKMIEELNVQFPVQLIVVGRIQDEVRFQWFKKEALKKNLPICFITDKRASKGSDFLYLADFVIGTGRSFMEALSLGIPTLTPAQNADWPILVNEKNFSMFFSTNFSERNRADAETLKNNKDEINKLITNKIAYSLAQKNAKMLFQAHFSTDLILTKYSEAYKDIRCKAKQRINLLFKNFPYLLKFYFIDK